MKRLFKPIKRNDDSYRAERLEKEIKELDSLEEMSEWQFKSREMKIAELKYIRRMTEDDKDI